MKQRKTVRFPTYNVSLGDAIVIVKELLDDDTIALQTKILCIENVAEMATHNSVTKAELIHALRWIFEHYDFSEG